MLRSLADLQLDTRLQAEATEGTPILGICLGMQSLFESSEEAPGVRGLGLFSGQIVRFRDVPRVPHIGWNDVRFKDHSSGDFYFANSFYAPLSEFTTGICEYGVEFSAAVRNKNVAGIQFHPEKSGEAGLKILLEWCLSC
jgi:imidazole glycerol phosphate synthase glutamine amidotransferase subunit